MADIRKAFFSGRLVRDSETKEVGQIDVLEFSIACSEFYKKKNDDEYTKIVHYFDFQIWGSRGMAIMKYLVKGKAVSIECAPKQDRWEDAGGKARNRVIYVVNEIQFDTADAGGARDEAPRGRGHDDDDVQKRRDRESAPRGRDDMSKGRGADEGREGGRAPRRDDRDRGNGRGVRDRPRESEDDFSDDIPF